MYGLVLFYALKRIFDIPLTFIEISRKSSVHAALDMLVDSVSEEVIFDVCVFL